MEGCGFRDLKAEFEKKNAAILGVSFDTPAENAAFARACAEAGLTICGEARSMQEAVAYVRQLLPRADIHVNSGRQSGHMRYDPSTTEAVIGYSPQFLMEEGFRRTINMVRAKRGLPAV